MRVRQGQTRLAQVVLVQSIWQDFVDSTTVEEEEDDRPTVFLSQCYILLTSTVIENGGV